MKIQANIIGYPGEPVTLLSFYDAETSLLVVHKDVKYREDRVSDSVIVSNTDLPARESLFDNDQVEEGILCYLEMKNSGRIDMREAAARFDPSQKIQPVESTNAKVRFQVHPLIDNGAIAVIATCWHVKRAKGIERHLSAADALYSIARGSILSI